MNANVDPSPEQIKKFFTTYLNYQKMSQGKFCLDNGISPSNFSEILNGKRPLSGGVLADLASALGYKNSPSKLKDHILKFNLYGFESIDHCIEIGDQQTLWIMESGTGEAGFEIIEENVRIVYEDKFVEFLPNLKSRIAQIEAKISSGEIKIQNNELLAIQRMATNGYSNQPLEIPFVNHLSCYPQDERFLQQKPRIEMTLRKTYYSAFYAMQHDKEALQTKQDLLVGWNYTGGILRELAIGLGVNIAIIASDDAILLGRRGGVSVREGEFDVGVVEGLRLQDAVDGKIKIHDVAIRGVREEYGLLEKDIEGVHILGLGYDLQYSQWNFIGVCYVNKPGNQLNKIRKLFAVDRREYDSLESNCCDPKSLFETLAGEEAIWSCGLATAFYACIHKWGREITISACEGFKLNHPEQYLSSRANRSSKR